MLVLNVWLYWLILEYFRINSGLLWHVLCQEACFCWLTVTLDDGYTIKDLPWIQNHVQMSLVEVLKQCFGFLLEEKNQVADQSGTLSNVRIMTEKFEGIFAPTTCCVCYSKMGAPNVVQRRRRSAAAAQWGKKEGGGLYQLLLHYYVLVQCFLQTTFGYFFFSSRERFFSPNCLFFSPDVLLICFDQSLSYIHFIYVGQRMSWMIP